MNIFCMRTTRPTRVQVCLAALVLCASAGTSSVSRAIPGVGDTSEADRCQVELDLMAVVYNDHDDRRSFAMVVAGKSTRMVRVGSYVAQRRVVAIVPRALWLTKGSGLCWLPLAHEGSQRVAPPVKAKKRQAAKRKAPKKR